MHAITGLQKLLRRSIPSLHLKRLSTLTDIVGRALRGGRPQDPAPRLQAPTVGRAAASKIAMRRYSRLIGNKPTASVVPGSRPRCRAAWVRDGLTWRFWRGSVCMN